MLPAAGFRRLYPYHKGSSTARRQLYKELESAGCSADTFKLILIKGGDFDHTGNAASLRSRYGRSLMKRV